MPRSTVVLVSGPQASGKSRISSALATALRGSGVPVALVELDGIAAMAAPALDWPAAYRIFVDVVGGWAAADLSVVVADGAGTRDEVLALRGALPDDVAFVVVALSTTLPVAFARAARDGSRGISRDHDFLRGVYERWPEERAAIAADVDIDTGATTVEEAVELIRAAVHRANGPAGRPSGTPAAP